MDEMNRRSTPPTGSLTAFEQVARTGSISEAARQSSLTQGAVSRRISTLETDLGVRLFHRRAGGIELTAAGQTYLDEIAPALALIRAATRRQMGPKRHSLSIALPPTFGMRWLAPRLASFRSACPGLELEFAARWETTDLKSDGLDAAVRLGDSPWPGLRSHELFGEMIAPVCAPNLALSINGPDDLIGHDLLIQATRPTAWRDWLARKSVVRYDARPGLVFEHFMMVIEAATAGAGIALVPIFLVEPELACGKLVILGTPETGLAGSYHLVYRADASEDRALAMFRDWLLAESAAYAPRGWECFSPRTM